MRRALFGDGFPRQAPYQAAPDPDTALQILDLRFATPDTQSRVYLVTLFAYAPLVPVGGPLSVSYQNASNTPIFVATQDFALQGATFADAPVKILDRMAFRGPFRLFAHTETDAAIDVRIFGYFELDAENPSNVSEVRPLQPNNNLVAPFPAGPQQLPAAAATTPIHALLATLTDEITLTYRARNGDEFGAIPILRLGAQAMPMKDLPAASPTSTMTLFDGIPMTSSNPLAVQWPIAGIEGPIVQGTFKRF